MIFWPAALPDPSVSGIFFGDVNVSPTMPESHANRLLCMKKMGDLPLITPYQTHSNIAVLVTDAAQEIGEADAVVTLTPNLAIGVVTADCAPVLFFGKTATGAPIIGAAHAGGRGALRGILDSTIQLMRDQGATGPIAAALGPCIRQSSEIGPEFEAAFTATDPRTIPFFKDSHFDLAGYVLEKLTALGCVTSDVAVDTYTHPHCFSYRRATHEGAPDYGRQLSAIALVP